MQNDKVIDKVWVKAKTLLKYNMKMTPEIAQDFRWDGRDWKRFSKAIKRLISNIWILLIFNGKKWNWKKSSFNKALNLKWY